MQLVHCNNLYEEFETNTVFSVNMFVPVYNKKAIFFGCKCAVLILFILIFFLYFIIILSKAKIINFITYTDISADHITTEFIIIKLIFESKMSRNLTTCMYSYFNMGMLSIFHGSAKSDYTFFCTKGKCSYFYIECYVDNLFNVHFSFF